MAQSFTADDFADTTNAPLTFSESDFSLPEAKPVAIPHNRFPAGTVSTTAGGTVGGGLKLTPFTANDFPDSESVHEVYQDVTRPAVPIPKFTVKPDDSKTVAVGKEAVNLALGVPEFMESPAGIASLGAGAVIPKTIAGLFTADTLHNVGNQILQTHKDWDSYTPAQKAAAVTDIAGQVGFAGLLGHTATKGMLDTPTDRLSKALADNLNQADLNKTDVTPTPQTRFAIPVAQASKLDALKLPPEPSKPVLATPTPPEPKNVPTVVLEGNKGVPDWSSGIKEHASSVKATESGDLLDADGNTIKKGDKIYMGFAGRPSDMPQPWTLVSAENFPSSVNYKLNPRVTVRAADGTERTYDYANRYSPRKINEPPAIDLNRPDKAQLLEDLKALDNPTPEQSAKRDALQAESDSVKAKMQAEFQKVKQSSGLTSSDKMITKGNDITKSIQTDNITETPLRSGGLAERGLSGNEREGQRGNAVQLPAPKESQIGSSQSESSLETGNEGVKRENPVIIQRIDARDRRDWSKVPGSFEQDAVSAAFKDIKELFPKQAISQRVRASKATTFQDLRAITNEALKKYRPELLESSAPPQPLTSETPAKPLEAATGKAKPTDTPTTATAKVAEQEPITANKQTDEPTQHTSLGGALHAESLGESPKTATGIKNATVDKERALRGLPAAIEPARRAFGTVWDEAMAKVDKDPDAQSDLIKELKKMPRAVTDTEDAMLLQRQIDLQNEYGKNSRELAQAHDDAQNAPNEEARANRLSDVQDLKIREARLSDELLDLYNINKRVGTETGRGLNARKMMAYEDYSLAAMETKLRAAKDGKPLTPEEKKHVNILADRVSKTQKDIEDYQRKIEANDSKAVPALKSLKTRYANKLEELKARMAGNDFTPKSKTPLVLDKEAMRLKAAYENAKLKFDRLVMAERLKNRSLLEKTQDTFVKWRRAFLLSSPVTLAKLTSAAVERMAITPTEEAIGGVYSKLPVLNRVAALAPREGGINVKAEAKALTDGFMKGFRDSWDTLRTGHSQLDSLYGKRDVMPREMIDFIGSIHGALKSPVKRAEYARSIEKRFEFALRNGQDVLDPLVQTKIAVEAFKDSQRSIFMQDNRLSALWNARRAILEKPDKDTGKVPLGSKVLSSAMGVVLPIVKVPTNIVGETLQYAFGSVTGSTRLAFALKRGVETLKPAEADLIMRELKKGSLGAALLVTGYLLPDMFGGYYQENDRKALGHPAFGTMKIFGHSVPSMLIHNPLLETMQIGATVRRVADSKLRKKDTNPQGNLEGIKAGLLGLTDEVPFVREPRDFLRLFNPYESDKFADQFARDMIVPLGVSWVAQHFDRDVNGNYVARSQESLAEAIQSAIPLMRERLPIDAQKTADLKTK